MKVFQHSKILLLVAGISVLFFQACKEVEIPQARKIVREFDNTVMLKWNKVFLNLDRYAVGYRPGPVPHALGHIGFSAYEAVVPGMPGYNSLANLYPDLEMPKFDESLEYHWPAVINESNAYLMRRFFFHMEASYNNLYRQIEQTRIHLHDQYALETTPEILARSEERGRLVALAVYEWEEKDLAAEQPEKVKELIVVRTENDKRSAWLKWPVVDNATGYNIYLGTAPEKLYNCIMVLGRNEYWLKTMDKDLPFYFTIEAFNENGISERTQIIKSE